MLWLAHEHCTHPTTTLWQKKLAQFLWGGSLGRGKTILFHKDWLPLLTGYNSTKQLDFLPSEWKNSCWPQTYQIIRIPLFLFNFHFILLLLFLWKFYFTYNIQIICLKEISSNGHEWVQTLFTSTALQVGLNWLTLCFLAQQSGLYHEAWKPCQRFILQTGSDLCSAGTTVY